MPTTTATSWASRSLPSPRKKKMTKRYLLAYSVFLFGFSTTKNGENNRRCFFFCVSNSRFLLFQFEFLHLHCIPILVQIITNCNSIKDGIRFARYGSLINLKLSFFHFRVSFQFCHKRTKNRPCGNDKWIENKVQM